MNEYDKRFIDENLRIAKDPAYINCVQHYQKMIIASFSQKRDEFTRHAREFLKGINALPSNEMGNQVKKDLRNRYGRFREIFKDYRNATPEERKTLLSPEKLLYK